MGRQCPGCHTIFTRRGLYLHQTQMHDTLCQLKATTQHSDFEMDSSGDESPGPADNVLDIVDENAMFKGQEDNILDIVDDNAIFDDNAVFEGQEDLGISSDVEAEMQAELEQGWEPERADAPVDVGDSLSEDVRVDGAVGWEDVDTPDSSANTPTNPNQRRDAEFILIGDGHGVTPQRIVKYTDRYPLSHAGEPVGREDAMDSRYNAAVDGTSNPWAPFHSKLDWEVAQWAKLRGPGSNAFSELLGLGEVSYTIFFRLRSSI